MEILRGYHALRMAEDVSKVGGDFFISFYPYSRMNKQEPGTAMKEYHHCRVRKQLPHEKWSVDGKNFFLFEDENGKPKMCYRVLIRYMGFSNDDYNLKKIQWYE